MEKTICVIGIGNLLRRDDAIGIILLDFLRKNDKKLLSNVSFLDGGTSGMNVLHLLSDYKNVLIIDAVKFGGTSGQWKFFSYDEIASQKKPEYGSTHISDILQVVMLAKKLYQMPECLYVFGVEPEDISFGQGLSETLKNYLPELKDCVKEKLQWMINTILVK